MGVRRRKKTDLIITMEFCFRDYVHTILFLMLRRFDQRVMNVLCFIFHLYSVKKSYRIDFFSVVKTSQHRPEVNAMDSIISYF